MIEDPADLPRVGLLFALVEGFLSLPGAVGRLLVARVPSGDGARASADG